jgi:hypothetical protein
MTPDRALLFPDAAGAWLPGRPVRTLLYLAVAVLTAITLAPPAVFGEIIISEIMFNPQGSDNDSTGTNYTYSREWTELYNTGATSVDISGWQFGDSQDNNWASPFPTGTTIGAGQALVVTGDAATFDANWGSGINRIQVSAFPNQANSVGTNEGAAIRNSSGVLQDVVRYQETGWPTANGSDGNSIYLLPGAMTSTANDVGANWKPSSAGAYGAWWTNGGGKGENHGSPGVVVTTPQTPFAPSPDARWSMVVFPDTQNYSKSTTNFPIFTQMTNWVKDHRDEYKIQLVLQEGDIVNRNNESNPSSGELPSAQQWANASSAMGVLDGVVPYVMAVGNHDLGTGDGTAQNRLTEFNTYFPPSRNPLNDPAHGGILKGTFQPGHNENAYYELHAPDGRNLLIFSLEFWPTNAMVNWANQVASQPQYADYTALLVTHSYLTSTGEHADADPDTYPIGASGDYNDGLQLWNKLIKVNPNFEMTFSGHVGGDGVSYLQSTNVEGDPVHQMMINAQFETNGGNGWFRLVEFLNDGKTVRVRTFSPFLGLYRTDSANYFQIALSQLTYQPADFTRNKVVDGDDLAVWLANFGQTTGGIQTQGDADVDGDIDGADLLVWQRQLGSASAVAAGSAVPEPASAALAAVVLAIFARPMRRRS